MEPCDLCGNAGPERLGWQCIKCNYPTELMGLKKQVAEQAETIEKLKVIIGNQHRQSGWLSDNIRELKYELKQAKKSEVALDRVFCSMCLSAILANADIEGDCINCDLDAAHKDINTIWEPALSLAQATLDKVVGDNCPWTENGHCDECIRCLQKRLVDEQAAEEYAHFRADKALKEVEALVELIRNTPNTPIEIVGQGKALENLSSREKVKK